MAKQNTALYLLLALGLVAVFSIYISQRSLKETLKREKQERVKLQAQGPTRQIPSNPRIIRKKGKFEEAKKVTAPEKEIDLQQIPEDFVYKDEKAATPEQALEAAGSPEAVEAGTLKKVPSASELKELKSKGLIIY